MPNYLLACNKNWHINFFMKNRKKLSGNWSIATCASDLEAQVLRVQPRFVFFPHWSEIVPSNIFESFECVCFHMTAVPYGRGGSPLQNLIIRGHSKTVISALKMNKNIDAGPVYLKHELDLSGSALEIYKKTAPICFDMMNKIISEEIEPINQVGEPTVFTRRRPDESEIPKVSSIQALYDFIRMLDAPGYPAAFLEHYGMKIEFSEANLTSANELHAKVKVIKHEK